MENTTIELYKFPVISHELQVRRLLARPTQIVIASKTNTGHS